MKQSSFGLVGVLVVVLTLGVVGFGGWYLLSEKQSGDDREQIETVQDQEEISKEQAASSDSAPEQEADIQDTEAKLSDETEGVKPEKVSIPSQCDYTNDIFSGVIWDVPVYEEVQREILGEWTGCVFTPEIWNGPGRQDVLMTINFKDNGTYEVQNLQDNSIAVLYAGDNLDNPEKTYKLFDVQDNGKVSGEIMITGGNGFNTTTSNFFDMELTGNRLRFSFLHRNQYGPIELRLVRSVQQ